MTPHPFARTPGLRRRALKERLWRAMCWLGVGIAGGAAVALLGAIAFAAAPAFTDKRVVVPLDAQTSDKANVALRALLPGANDSRQTRRDASRLLSRDAQSDLTQARADGDSQAALTLSADAQAWLKGLLGDASTRLSQRQVGWLETLERQDRIATGFHTAFFTNADSRDPERAGALGALIGAALTFFVTLILSAPLGILAAIHLEEFAPSNRLTRFLEVNINNLAAVPSIVFGLLGLAIFLNAMGLERSTPLVGGMTLALLTLPTIIIAARASLRAVPRSIREAALGVGASRAQMVFHHVAPYAMPGILTGVILGMSRAIGETAPLLMIGMVAFLADVPSSPTDPATTLPVQAFIWFDSPERLFAAKTAAAIALLLVVLLALNAGAILARGKFNKR